jgi:hypothetical protein
MGVISFFGFTLIELDGGKVWCAASEADFRKSMSRMGLSESAIEDAVRGKLLKQRSMLGTMHRPLWRLRGKRRPLRARGELLLPHLSISDGNRCLRCPCAVKSRVAGSLG